MSERDWALVVVMGAGALALLMLSLVLANLFRVVNSLKTLTDGVREGTLPIIAEIGGTVRNVNKEIERVDGIIGSVETITHNVATVTEAVKMAVSNPLVKVAAFTFGARRAAKKLRREDD